MAPVARRAKRVSAAGIPTLPHRGLLGHLGELQRDPLGLFVRAQAHADTVRLKVAHVRPVLLFNPESFHRVLVGNPANYEKQTRGYERLRFVLGNSVLTGEGEFWKRQRKIMQPAFHTTRLATLSQTMSSAASQLVDDLRSHEDGAAIDVSEMSLSIALQIAGETMFGTDTSNVNEEILRSLTALQKGFKRITYSALPLAEWVPSVGNWRYHRALRTMDRIVYGIIEERRAQSPRLDLLGLLMEPPDGGDPMSNEQVRNEALTMLLAGHETVAALLVWTLHQLSREPECQRRLQEEVDTVLSGRTPEMADLASLPYTRNVLFETLRLYPSVWAIGRVPREDDEIGGFHVPRGVVVYMCPYATHRHPGLWDRPLVFDPDRWDGDPLADRHNLTFFPFGGGRRKCIGDRFAMLEATILVATLCQHYRFVPVEGFEVEIEATVTLRPRHGLMMHLERRT